MASRHQRKLRKRATKLRNNMTSAEKLLWSRLKGEQLGAKFRRQHATTCYILDFYCPAMKLAVEVDGPIHERQKAKDIMRDANLSRDGIVVLRFQNSEIFTGLEDVLECIREHLDAEEEDVPQTFSLP